MLAIVIAGGAPGVGALGLANSVLEVAGGLHGLLRLTPDDLCRIAGVGTARAAQVLAALELGRRSLVRQPPERRRVVSPRDVAELLLPEFSARPVEQFGVVLLDTKHHVLRTVVVSSGGLDCAPVQVRDVFRHAAACSAAAVVVFHNHPSGDPRPSQDDLRLTARLVAAGELMGIPVLDHVVLGDNRYWSCKEMGELGAE